jgi:KTSC domain
MPQQTFSNVQPIQQARGTPQTFTDVTPINAQPSVWDVLTQPTDKTDQEYTRYTGPAGVAGATIKGLDDVARGTRGALAGAWNSVRHPIDTAKSIAELPAQAAEVPAAIRDINQSPDPFGVYAAVAQDTAAQGAGQALTALGTAGLAKGVTEAAPYVGPVGGALIKGYAKKLIPDEALTAYKAVKNTRAGQLADAMQPDPAAVSPSRTMPGEVAPEIIQPSRPVAPPARGPLYLPEQTPSTIDQALNSPSRSLSGQIAAEMTRPSDAAPSAIPSRSGLVLPPAPLGAELSELPPTGAKPAAATGEALGRPGRAGQIAASMQKPAPSADVSNGFKRGSLGDLLDQSLGAKKLEPNVPLRKQMPATSGAISSSVDSPTDLPAGHIPVKSSALSSYKYDPSAREFEAKATSGNTVYVYGDVDPEDVKSFEGAESKGKAWQAIRQNPLVAKIVNGKRIAVKAGQ